MVWKKTMTQNRFQIFTDHLYCCSRVVAWFDFFRLFLWPEFGDVEEICFGLNSQALSILYILFSTPEAPIDGFLLKFTLQNPVASLLAFHFSYSINLTHINIFLVFAFRGQSSKLTKYKTIKNKHLQQSDQTEIMEQNSNTRSQNPTKIKQSKSWNIQKPSSARDPETSAPGLCNVGLNELDQMRLKCATASLCVCYDSMLDTFWDAFANLESIEIGKS